MIPLVVFALQSPTLLNILARSKLWRLRVAVLDDVRLAEAVLLEAQPWSLPERPSAVVVCSAAQEDRAHALWPGVPVTWLLHNGRREILPPRPIERALALSQRVRVLQLGNGVQKVRVVVPAYEAERTWRSGSRIWTMVSRPASRRPEYIEALRRLSVDLPLEWYGDGQARGLLIGEERRALEADCAAYLTPLPPWSGFGLAQHECLAAGVPLVGTRWGDFDHELPGYTSLTDDPARQREALELLLTRAGRSYAESLSCLGEAFIREHRTRERMDAGIRAALEMML